jgi:hypothetical protein
MADNYKKGVNEYENKTDQLVPRISHGARYVGGMW